MFEIVIQIKDGENYRTLIEGPDKCKDAADLLPEFVRDAWESWEKKAPDSKEVRGDNLKDSMYIEWKNYRFIFSEIYWD